MDSFWNEEKQRRYEFECDKYAQEQAYKKSEISAYEIAFGNLIDTEF
jgi:hypothetical protein